MPDDRYSDDELQRYFNDPEARRAAATPAADGDARAQTLLVLKRIGVGIGVLAGLALLAVVVLSFTLPSTELIENPEHLEATVVYTADGVEMARYYLGENRTWVTADEISPVMYDALVSLEDRRFYEHWGVDMRGFAAVLKGFLTGQGLRGASTITMQLARNLYDQIGTERTPIRKAREMLTAVQLERRYTKDEIIEMYLNTVAWNYNAFGIEAAAETYFSKPAAELTVEEAAMLVGMLKGPSGYNPVRHPERAQDRRNLVMASMVREGKLSSDDYARLREQPIELAFRPYSHTDNLAPHLAEIMRKELEVWGKENGYDIYSDGLVVHTSLDSRIQAMAREAVEEQTAKLQAVVDYEWGVARPGLLGNYRDREDAYPARMARGDVEPWSYFWQRNTRLSDAFVRDTDRWRALRERGLDRSEATAQLRADEAFMDSLHAVKTRLEAGLVAVEPETGFVRAWVGGRDFVTDKFDHVKTARRQPGSTFKPFVYIAAIDNGYSPYYRVMDSTFVWRQAGLPPWRPKNSGGTSGSYVTLRTALSQSKNIPTARLTQEVSPATVRRYAERLGVESEVEAVPSIGLGVSDVTLLEMVTAYATLANDGVYHRARSITRIEDRQGNTIAELLPQGREALSASTAYTVVDMMRGVIDDGTGQRMRWKFGLNEYDLAGKTGTTQESADGWFILMHPDLVVGAWVGWNDRRVAFRSDWWGQGAHNALHLVGDFAERLAEADNPSVRLQPERRFEEPDGYVPPAPPPPPPGMDDRPARDLLQRWEERDRRLAQDREPPEKRDRERRGRVGW